MQHDVSALCRRTVVDSEDTVIQGGVGDGDGRGPVGAVPAGEVGEQQVSDALTEVDDVTRRVLGSVTGEHVVGQYGVAIVVVTGLPCRRKPGPEVGDAAGPHLVQVFDVNVERDLEGILLGGHVSFLGRRRSCRPVQ